MREFFFLGSREKNKLFHAHTSSFFLLLFPQQVHAKAGKADEAGEAMKVKAPKMKAPKAEKHADEAGEAMVSGKKADKMAMKAAADAKAAELEAAAAPKPDFKQAMDKLKKIKAGEKILKKQKGGESDEAVSS